MDRINKRLEASIKQAKRDRKRLAVVTINKHSGVFFVQPKTVDITDLSLHTLLK